MTRRFAQWGDQSNYMSYGNTLHPFTQIQITDKGLDELAKLVENVRGCLDMIFRFLPTIMVILI